MRAAIRLLTAILIITALILISRDLKYIHVLQASIHNSTFRLSRSHGAEYKKLHGKPPDDTSIMSIAVDAKTDASPIMFVSTPDTMEETIIHTPAPVHSGLDRIVVIGRTSGEDTSWVEQLDT